MPLIVSLVFVDISIHPRLLGIFAIIALPHKALSVCCDCPAWSQSLLLGAFSRSVYRPHYKCTKTSEYPCYPTVTPPGFSFLRIPRRGRSGDEVELFISDALSLSQISLPDQSSIEAICYSRNKSRNVSLHYPQSVSSTWFRYCVP